MTTDDRKETPAMITTPYVPAHGGMCPIGPHLVCADYNAMPQRMWRTNHQHWRCEGCGTPMTRTFAPATGWSPWRPTHR